MEGILDDNGINVDKTGVSEETLKEHGSSIEDLLLSWVRYVSQDPRSFTNFPFKVC